MRRTMRKLCWIPCKTSGHCSCIRSFRACSSLRCEFHANLWRTFHKLNAVILRKIRFMHSDFGWILPVPARAQTSIFTSSPISDECQRVKLKRKSDYSLCKQAKKVTRTHNLTQGAKSSKENPSHTHTLPIPYGLSLICVCSCSFIRLLLFFSRSLFSSFLSYDKVEKVNCVQVFIFKFIVSLSQP